MPVSRIFPINFATGAGGAVNDADDFPRAAMQSITMTLRFGRQQYAIGYVHAFTWNMTRQATPIHQIEAYPNGTFGNTVMANAEFTTSTYWPGEPVEIIPGKVGGIEIQLSKYAFYSSNLLRSLLTIEGAGTEHVNPATSQDAIHYSGALQNEYVSVIQQVRPIYIHQQFLGPTTGRVVFGRTFEEAWFTSISEEIPDSGTNMAILERGSLLATRMRPYVQGASRS